MDLWESSDFARRAFGESAYKHYLNYGKLEQDLFDKVVTDYERTFARFRTLSADVFLSNHPGFFRMEQKRKQMAPGAVNPFVDSGELQRFVTQSEAEFRETLSRESRAVTAQR